MELADHDRYHIRKTGREEKQDGSIHTSGGCLAVACAPCIRRMFIDAGLRGARGFGSIIFDPSHFPENVLKNGDGSFRSLGHEEGGF